MGGQVSSNEIDLKNYIPIVLICDALALNVGFLTEENSAKLDNLVKTIELRYRDLKKEDITVDLMLMEIMLDRMYENRLPDEIESTLMQRLGSSSLWNSNTNSGENEKCGWKKNALQEDNSSNAGSKRRCDPSLMKDMFKGVLEDYMREDDEKGEGATFVNHLKYMSRTRPDSMYAAHKFHEMNSREIREAFVGEKGFLNKANETLFNEMKTQTPDVPTRNMRGGGSSWIKRSLGVLGRGISTAAFASANWAASSNILPEFVKDSVKGTVDIAVMSAIHGTQSYDHPFQLEGLERKTVVKFLTNMQKSLEEVYQIKIVIPEGLKMLMEKG